MATLSSSRLFALWERRYAVDATRQNGTRACSARFRRREQDGDLTFAAYSWYQLITNLLATGDPLAEVQREAEAGLEFAGKALFGTVVDILTAQLAIVRTLRGLTTKFGSFGDGDFDELQFERRLSRNPALALPECRYWIRKLQARFLRRTIVPLFKPRCVPSACSGHRTPTLRWWSITFTVL